MADEIGFDSAAWSIDGARIDSELMRVLSYASIGGAEGIITPGDCRVHQLDVPGPQVVIDTGALGVLNRNADNQAYIANARRLSKLDVTATDSSGGRSDLVVVRMDDPGYPGGPIVPEEDAPAYQYVKPVVLQNVPPTTDRFEQLGLPYSGYALARIDIPASTATITDGLIKNLRKVANPRRERVSERYNITYAPNDMNSTNVWARYPDVPQTPLDIPEWATEMFVRVDVTGIMSINAGHSGHWSVFIGPYDQLREIGGAIPPGVKPTQAVYYNQQTWGDATESFILTDRIDIPTEMRGTRQWLTTNVIRGDGVGFWRSNIATHVVADVEFLETAV